ncbi:BTAD domain-containing putative transcriptional regulator [Nocardioides ganghwensis]|uniref:BTAD domain-containing putative transcriptional regulator n=1 Tax=Nocardioides ganghwensis TaxID=252230 RepID=UPI0013EB374E|nr:BTAD domain-containing putative transcriptional regulator [Nocardioides ganghwensis]MBD3948032.1 tetratricopeptide repeat protein [Nocardioides ganghwensis]
MIDLDRLELLLLGAVELRAQGLNGAADRIAPRERALLARLALDVGRVVTVDRLIDDLWGDAPPSGARNTLQVYVSHLRRRLGQEVIRSGAAGYSLALDPSSVDTHEFGRRVAAGAHLVTSGRPGEAVGVFEAALRLWRGDQPLADLGDYEFARVEAARLTQLRAAAVQYLAEALLAIGDDERIVDEVAPLVREFPFRERLRAAVMTAMYRQGRGVEALDMYGEARAFLRDELGLDPGPVLKALHTAILADDPALVAAAPQAQRVVVGALKESVVRLDAADAPPTNLRSQPTALLGRAQELVEVCGLLRDQRSRLVTLTGPGGTGKTRLGFEVAAEVLKDFPGGVYSVELAAVGDPSDVMATVAQTLGVQEGAGRTVEQALRELLRDRRLLLVLDNFEQVIAAAPDVAALLADCQSLSVLVTSRQPLRQHGEQEYPVPPLAVPDQRSLALASTATLAQFEALALFVERAQAVKPSFKITDRNVRAVAEICIRLDGLPLAIELAAVRIKVLPPQAMLERVGQRLRLLTAGARGVTARQQTLRGTIDWSYDLLTASERLLFARLAVFVDGCTLEAAEAVCDADNHIGLEVLDGLASLVDKNLVRQDESPQGEPRFTMLETVREYAEERLVSDPAHAVVRDRHADFFSDLAVKATAFLQSMEGRGWRDKLEVEHGNLRSATEWLLETQRIGPAMDIAIGAWRVWIQRGRLREGAALIERVLAHSDGSEDPKRARALMCLGELYRFQGDFERARATKEAGLPILRQAVPVLAAATLCDLGHIAERQDRLDDARALHQEALDIQIAVGMKGGIIHATTGLARLAVGTGELVRARSLYRQVLEGGRELGDAEFMNEALLGLAEIARREGDRDRSRRLYDEALVLGTEMWDVSMVFDVLAGMASLAVACGQPRTAAHLLGAVDAIAVTTGLVPYFTDQREQCREEVRAVLVAAEYADLLAKGRAMTYDDAVAYALTW